MQLQKKRQGLYRFCLLYDMVVKIWNDNMNLQGKGIATARFIQ
jgi:hypothetical protein